MSETPGRLQQELGLIGALWRRDMTHLVRQKSRWFGVIAQPLIFWLVIGSGMSSVFKLEGAGDDYLAYFFPGILAMVVLFTAVFATMSVIEDRQHGFLQQVMVVPASRTSLVLGKTAGVTSMALIQLLLCLVVAPWAGVNLLAVHWPALLATAVLGCVALTALNFCLAWVIDSTAGYHGIMGVLLFPLWILSGAMFPAQAGWIRGVMIVNPLAYLVDGLRNALAGGDSSVANFELGTSLLVLTGMAIAFVALAVLVVERRSHGGRA